MVHNMKLQAEPFRKIKDGSKTIELRLLDEKSAFVNKKVSHLANKKVSQL